MQYVNTNQLEETVQNLPGQQRSTVVPKPQDEAVSNKKIIRDIGLKVTKQRQLILDVVRNGPTHFTAQEINEAVGDKGGDIGFATVYRFLKKLSEHKYLTEFRIGGMPARYEWASKNHHDHLTCVQCGLIVEFENDQIEQIQSEIAIQHGFNLTSHVLELYGTCKGCSQK